jgi:two-component system sensor histidine kinase ChvG
LFVTNEGAAIPTDKLDNIFDSMVSIRETDTRLHFGMGLYVVRVIAEHHGGSVNAANLLNGNGVTIRVTLPLFAPDNNEEPTEQ